MKKHIMWIVEVVSYQLLDLGVCVVLSEASEPLSISWETVGIGVIAILCQHEMDFEPSFILTTKFVIGYNIQSVSRVN